MKNLGKWSIASVGMIGLLALGAGPAMAYYGAGGEGGNASAYATPENLGGYAGGNAGMASGTPLFCIAPAPGMEINGMTPLAGDRPIFELAHGHQIPVQSYGIAISYTVLGKTSILEIPAADLSVAKNYGSGQVGEIIALNAAGIKAFISHYPNYPGVTTITLENYGAAGRGNLGNGSCNQVLHPYAACPYGVDQYRYSADPAQNFLNPHSGIGGYAGGNAAPGQEVPTP